MRLDCAVFYRGLLCSRNKARELIKSGFVCVNGEIVHKPSFEVDLDCEIKILKHYIYVSRAGEKLDLYLSSNAIDFSGCNVLDIGSSKGGFTQVVLKYGAKSVTCVDVGSNQLDSSLRNDSRVKLFENCDIKEFQSDVLFDFVLCDVSFISLRMIVEHIYTLSKSFAILLFKPQFEVGRAVKRNKNGVVVDDGAIRNSLESFLLMLEEQGFVVLNVQNSLLKGKEGNEEIFIYIKKQ